MGFQQGISGLNAASKNLDVIGHNIANSGTVGFKASRTEFSDLVASSMAAGSNSGFGVQVAAISQQFAQGGLNMTGNGMDVAINGNGFFKLQMPDGSSAYTRAGNFKLDKSGDVVTNDGARVMGYKIDPATGVAGSSTVPLSFPVGAPIAAKQTTGITVSLNLDARANLAAGKPAVPATATAPAVAAIPATPRSTYGTSLNVYDSQGVATPVNLYFEKDTTANTWKVFDKLDAPPPAAAATPIGTVKFDANGRYDPTSTPLTLTVKPATNPNAPPVADISVKLDLSGMTQFGSKFAVSELEQDGYASGELKDIKISEDGTVMASYSNGVLRAEAQLALTSFRNPQGLVAVGGNNWVVSGESGTPVDGKPGSGSLGSLRSGALEESNVDLTAELVNMMTAQRSYQANAQTIKTQDQVMSTLVNLR
ncbi:MAG: flagellar hook protein FlgE [Simplicispira sp.]|nr:flagellar hook protein FlgE [Simplicispira sp.]